MIFDAPPQPGHGIEIAKAVVIATLSAFTAGMVQWGLEELKERRRRRRENESQEEDRLP